MELSTFSQIFTIYGWFPLAVLLTIVLLVGRFYQNLTGENTRYKLFAVPIVLFGVASASYASANRVVGVLAGDLLLAAGGLVLSLLCMRLYRQMTAGR